MVKRVRGHLIRKDVDDVPVQDSSNRLLNETSSRAATASPSSQPPSAQPAKSTSPSHLGIRRPTCDGPTVAKMFRKFVDLFDEIPSLDLDPHAKNKCCDACRPLVVKRSAYLHDVLLQWAAELEDIQEHRYDNEETSTSQHHDISPIKNRAKPFKSPIFIQDSDSDSNYEST